MIRWIIYRWEGYMKLSAAQKKEADSGNRWKGFRPGGWSNSINVRDFIVRNVTPYTGERGLPRRRIAAHKGRLGETAAVFRGREEEGRAGGRCSRRRRPCSPTRPAISTATTRSSSDFRPTSRSSGRSSRSAVCEWSRPASRPPASNRIRPCTRLSRSTASRTMTASSTPIRRRS